MSYARGFKPVQSVTSKLGGSIRTTFSTRRQISTWAASKFNPQIQPIVPHIKKQGAVDCFYTCADIVKSIHRIPEYRPISFWDTFKLFMFGKPPEYTVVQTMKGELPSSEKEFHDVLSRFGPFVMKAQNLTASHSTGFQYEDGEPALTRFTADSFHCIVPFSIVDVEGTVCVLYIDPEGGGVKVNHIETCLMQSVSRDTSPDGLDPSVHPDLNRIKEFVNIAPLKDLLAKAVCADDTQGVYVAGTKLEE